MFKTTSYYTVTNIRFQFRKGRGSTSAGTLQAVIRIEGQEPSGPISTAIKCTREVWDARRKARPGQEVQALNTQMVQWKESIYKAAKNLYDEGEPILPETLVEEKNSLSANLLTLEQLYAAYLSFKKERVGSSDPLKRLPGQISAATIKTYGKRWKYLKKYLKEIGAPRMYAVRAKPAFVEDYRAWLHKGGLAIPTATKYVKLLSEMLNWGVERGLIKNLAVLSFKGSTEPLSLPYNVTEEEVLRIEALELQDSKLEAVRDGWLLARELCLHFVDYAGLKPDNFTLDKKNRVVFEKVRQKQEAGRKIMQLSFVSERALSIWKRYNYAIPIFMQNGKFNEQLKVIGHLAELSQPLSFCHARDSGIFRWLAGGVPDVQVQLAPDGAQRGH